MSQGRGAEEEQGADATGFQSENLPAYFLFLTEGGRTGTRRERTGRRLGYGFVAVARYRYKGGLMIKIPLSARALVLASMLALAGCSGSPATPKVLRNGA